jgi:hypothetical protein
MICRRNRASRGKIPQEDSRAVGDYVIVHELLHFSVPHHGKLWKSLMRAHLNDYERLDRKLKRFATRGNLHVLSPWN